MGYNTTVGGNLGTVQARAYGWKHTEDALQLDLLRVWADKLGYDLVQRKT